MPNERTVVLIRIQIRQTQLINPYLASEAASAKCLLSSTSLLFSLEEKSVVEAASPQTSFCSETMAAAHLSRLSLSGCSPQFQVAASLFEEREILSALTSAALAVSLMAPEATARFQARFSSEVENRYERAGEHRVDLPPKGMFHDGAGGPVIFRCQCSHSLFAGLIFRQVKHT